VSIVVVVSALRVDFFGSFFQDILDFISREFRVYRKLKAQTPATSGVALEVPPKRSTVVKSPDW